MDFNALYFRHKRAEQRVPGTTGIQTKAPYDKTHLVYLVADMGEAENVRHESSGLENTAQTGHVQ